METQTRRPQLNSILETAEALKVGRSTVYQLMESGQLRSIKIGRRRLISDDAIGEYIDGLENAGDAA